MRRFFDVASAEGATGTKAAVFNGSSSYMTVSNNVFVNITVFSISFWFKYSSSSTDRDTLFSSKGSASTKGFALFFDSSNGGKIGYYEGNGVSNSNYNYSTNEFNEGNWHSAALTRDSSGEVKLYIDENLQINHTPSILLDGHTYDLHIGRWTSPVVFYYDGSLDQVRIFNKALSQSEVTTLFQEGESAPLISTTDIFGDGSGVALYRFEDNANDESGNYNGVATNVTYQQ